MPEEIRSLIPSSVDVVHIDFPENAGHQFRHSTYRVKDLLERIKELSGIYEDGHQFFDERLECELLELGNHVWKKGKVRLWLQFLPESEEEKPEVIKLPENSIEFPLDEIRKSLNGAS